ncbi:TetR/AcrR family transcriptional regulator [Streptosporangium sp. 'caverna']|uniref:TetR/AcrR family transcriptional regulator n=1 Tax=Streptosporangium sp. 'caverna' TaxID=2202249 RepID=UPI000D7E8CF6|nr:TetR/AcrR family transcriptional regulator [Streptosporangium sp. 'caverna']AWS47300.1 TetR/AcrR family transcriptional regulator [Streptosporangium sp. 'caverna']
MAAALELFGKRDAEGVSIDDVASAAGASRALVYHYFGGKQELYVAALKSAAAQLEARLRPESPEVLEGPRGFHEGGRPIEELADGLKCYFDFVEGHAAGFAALLKGGPDNRDGEIGEIVDAVRQHLLRLIMKQMRLEKPGPALRVTLRSWTASVETAGLDWLEHGDMGRPALERMLVDQMLALLEVAARHDPQAGELLEKLICGQAS